MATAEEKKKTEIETLEYDIAQIQKFLYHINNQIGSDVIELSTYFNQGLKAQVTCTDWDCIVFALHSILERKYNALMALDAFFKGDKPVV